MNLKKYFKRFISNSDTSTSNLDNSKYIDNDKPTILRSKYPFESQEKDELDMKSRESLKFIKSQNNGWLQAEKSGAENCRELVLASYMEMTINDKIPPLDVQWLHEKESIKNEKALRSVPKSLEVANICKDEYENIWFRLIVRFCNNKTVQLGKYINEIYVFQNSLVDHGFKHLPVYSLASSITITESIKFYDRNNSYQTIRECKKTKDYFNFLFRNKAVIQSDLMFNFLRTAKLFLINESYTDSENINGIIPRSKDIVEIYMKSSFYFVTKPLTPQCTVVKPLQKDFDNKKYSTYLNQRYICNTYDISLLNEYFSNENYSLNDKVIKGVYLEKNTSKKKGQDAKNLTDISIKQDSLFSSNEESDSLSDTLTSLNNRNYEVIKPQTQYDQSSPSVLSAFTISDKLPEDVKIKVHLDQIKRDMVVRNIIDDVVVYRIKRYKLRSVEYLQKLVCRKIFGDFPQVAFKLQLRYVLKDINKYTMLQYIKYSENIHLDLIPRNVSDISGS